MNFPRPPRQGWAEARAPAGRRRNTPSSGSGSVGVAGGGLPRDTWVSGSCRRSDPWFFRLLWLLETWNLLNRPWHPWPESQGLSCHPVPGVTSCLLQQACCSTPWGLAAEGALENVRVCNCHHSPRGTASEVCRRICVHGGRGSFLCHPLVSGVGRPGCVGTPAVWGLSSICLAAVPAPCASLSLKI